MKNFRTNLFAQVSRWMQRGPALASDSASTGSADQASPVHNLPDPLTMFLLARRERRALRATNLGHPVLQFSNNTFSR